MLTLSRHRSGERRPASAGARMPYVAAPPTLGATTVFKLFNFINMRCPDKHRTPESAPSQNNEPRKLNSEEKLYPKTMKRNYCKMDWNRTRNRIDTPNSPAAVPPHSTHTKSRPSGRLCSLYKGSLSLLATDGLAAAIRNDRSPHGYILKICRFPGGPVLVVIWFRSNGPSLQLHEIKSRTYSKIRTPICFFSSKLPCFPEGVL